MAPLSTLIQPIGQATGIGGTTKVTNVECFYLRQEVAGERKVARWCSASNKALVGTTGVVMTDNLSRVVDTFDKCARSEGASRSQGIINWSICATAVEETVCGPAAVYVVSNNLSRVVDTFEPSAPGAQEGIEGRECAATIDKAMRAATVDIVSNNLTRVVYALRDS